MGKLSVLIGLITLLIAVGCGGSGGGDHLGGGRGDVSGIVFDENGFVVRDATISFGSHHSVQSNSSGVYILTDLPTDFVDLVATISQNGVPYVGENIALVQNGQRTKDVNIALYRQDSVASLQGVVTDRAGRRVVGVHIFLRPTTANTLLTSAVGITDNNGEFFVGSLKSNLTYNVQVNALGYNGDQETMTLGVGENRTTNFVLHDPVVTNVPAPTGLTVNAYTSPLVTRGDLRQIGAIEMMKQKLNPKRAVAKNRILSPNNEVEVDLFWDAIATQYQSALLGFGIYQGAGANQLRNIDFLRDPLAQFFADIDDTIRPGTSYSYAITSLDTLFDGSQGESSQSNTATTVPLGGLNINSITAAAHPVISWQAATGATKYTVYLYAQFPGLGISDIFDNASSPTTGTTFTYSASNLTSGQTYYVIVTGSDADGTAFSISPVTPFTVP